MTETKKHNKPRDGQTRVRVTYSPDGFRGVRDYDDEVAAIMIAESRAVKTDQTTPLGEDEPAGEYPQPHVADLTGNTSSNGGTDAPVSTAGASTTSSTSTSAR